MQEVVVKEEEVEVVVVEEGGEGREGRCEGVCAGFCFDCWWALLEEGKQGPAIHIIYWNSYAVAACNAR